ncbi:hypothetical protein [Pseudomonas syringae]|nr:hypothetical protein [Pseudomonas syringae]
MATGLTHLKSRELEAIFVLPAFMGQGGSAHAVYIGPSGYVWLRKQL